MNLADCYLALGRLEDAQRLLEGIEAETKRKGEWGDDWVKWRYQHLNASLAELRLAGSRLDDAPESANTCLEAALATNSPRNVVKARAVRGQIFLARAQFAAADQELVTATHIAREVGNPAQTWRSLAALGHLRLAQGRFAEACEAFEEGLHQIECVAADLTEEHVRETFVQSGEVKTMRAASAKARQMVGIPAGRIAREVEIDLVRSSASSAPSDEEAPLFGVHTQAREKQAKHGSPRVSRRSALQPRTAAAPSRLTARELVLSHKTVARHLERIFDKLGVSSRVGAAAALHSLDLD